MDPKELSSHLQSQKMRIHQFEWALEVEEALEKVRARTMAKHQSDEMLDTAKILFHLMENLGIALHVCGFSILEKEIPRGKQFLSMRATLFPEPLTFQFDKDDQLQKLYNAWEEQQPTLVLDIEGEELGQHITNMKQLVKELSSVEVLVGTAEEIAKDDVPSERLLAKDKSFNADFKTELDPDLPKINVIPQNIGRVLNLINNDFHAVSEAALSPAKGVKETDVFDYKTQVTISTKYLSDKIEIKVSDNGGDIPDEIKDKIFKPFFTTKSTGQRTGLGLSLSYDILKAHGGELGVESEKGQGSEFIGQLTDN